MDDADTRQNTRGDSRQNTRQDSRHDTTITLILGRGRTRPGLHVETVEGREAISRPYSFEATFRARDAIDPRDVIGESVRLSVRTEAGEMPVCGVAVAFRAEDPLGDQGHVYAIEIAPRLAMLDLTRQNQVYGSGQTVSVKDLIAREMQAGLADHHGHGAIPHELHLHATYRERDFLVQYEETDLAFLSRWCEASGIFYFFRQDGEDETVVFGDSNVAFAQVDALPYRHGHEALVTARPAVTAFGFTARPTAAAVILRDYNPAKPALPLRSRAEVAGGTAGTVIAYGQHFLEPEEGDHLARVRAEEIACRGQVFRGRSNVPWLRPGVFFNLTGHPSLDDHYLVTAVTHAVATPAPVGFGGPAVPEGRPYGNAFEAIPLAVPFRPERRTPRPVAAGLFTAFIDGEADGTRAEIDAEGRYKVRLRYDEGSPSSGKASEFIRKAEPYAGPSDTGMHFPLLKGTEVLLACVNGDIDRPVIVGAVPNPHTPNVVGQRNHTMNRFRSPSGTLFEMNDGLGPPPRRDGR